MDTLGPNVGGSGVCAIAGATAVTSGGEAPWAIALPRHVQGQPEPEPDPT